MDVANTEQENMRRKNPGCLYNTCRFFKCKFKVNAASMSLDKGKHNKALLPLKQKRIKRVRDVKSQFFVPLLNQLPQFYSMAYSHTAKTTQQLMDMMSEEHFVRSSKAKVGGKPNGTWFYYLFTITEQHYVQNSHDLKRK